MLSVNVKHLSQFTYDTFVTLLLRFYYAFIAFLLRFYYVFITGGSLINKLKLKRYIYHIVSTDLSRRVMQLIELGKVIHKAVNKTKFRKRGIENTKKQVFNNLLYF